MAPNTENMVIHLQPLDGYLKEVMPEICTIYDTMGEIIPVYNMGSEKITLEIAVRCQIRIYNSQFDSTGQPTTCIPQMAQSNQAASFPMLDSDGNIPMNSVIFNDEYSSTVSKNQCEPTHGVQSRNLSEKGFNQDMTSSWGVIEGAVHQSGEPIEQLKENGSKLPILARPQIPQLSMVRQKSMVNNTEEAIRMLNCVIALNAVWLIHINNAIFKLNESDDLSLLKNLKIKLTEYMKYVNIIYQSLTIPHLKTLKNPSLKAFWKSKKNLNAVLKNLTVEKLSNILPCEVKLSKDDFLASALGLNDELTNHLKSIPEDDRCHEPDDYYIKNFFKKRLNHFQLTGNLSAKDLLLECGFKENQAFVLAKHFETFPEMKQESLYYWVEQYLDHAFTYDVLFSDAKPRYHFQENVIDKQYTVECEDFSNEDEDADEDQQHPKFYNVKMFNSSGFSKTVMIDDANLASHEDASNFWFHGTDSLSVEKILQEGIQLREGKRSHDFCDQDGFNLFSDLASAKRWSMMNGRPAVIVFKKLDVRKYKGLDLSTNREEDWSRIIKYNRQEQFPRWAPPNDLKAEFKNCDYIYGPSSTDGGLAVSMSTEDLKDWQPSGYHDSSKYYCIRSDEMAQALGHLNNIAVIIFY